VERHLLKKLKERAKTGLAGQLTAMHIRHAIERWETKLAELVAEGQRSPSSLDTYAAPSRTTCS
jgi:hypothetical protein